MFADQGPTPYDINFHLGTIPVRVNPWFWAISAILGWQFVSDGFEYLLAWVGCVFVSILIHELGHVLMGMAFGTRGEILLWGFGGLAIGSSNLHERWQRIAVLLAGPGAQFILWGVLYGLKTQMGDHGGAMQGFIVDVMLFINFYWALLNLAPVFPLDGGQISRDLLLAFNRLEGVRWSLFLSIGTAAALGIYFGWYTGQIYPLVLFGLLAFQSYQLLQLLPSRDQQQRDRWSGAAPDHKRDRAPWEQDPDYWKK